MNENILNKSWSRDFLKSIILDQEKAFWQKDTGIQREQLAQIVKLVSSPYAVVISGLRRVGKSTLLAQLAHKIGRKKIYYVNFEDERLVGFTAANFNFLYEVLIELYGHRKIFILDEIQNVAGWEQFVRRFIDLKFKFFITGSNASLLSRELGTKLTGRYIPLELFPFSFNESILFNKYKLPVFNRLTTEDKGKIMRVFNNYLRFGGIPDALKYPALPIHQTLYNDVLYRDIVARYQITELRALKELAFYIMSNISASLSFNKLKEWLKLGSVNTVKNYIEYLENSWLLFVVNIYAYSVKKQQVAPKKIYCVDNGFMNSIAFSFSENKGKFMENLVFTTLRRKTKEIFYYKTTKEREVDFYLPRTQQLIQVTKDLSCKETQEREIEALKQAMDELKISSGLILTETDKKTVKIDRKKIYLQPLYQWLVKNNSK